VKLPYSKNTDVKELFFKATKNWLVRQPGLRGIYVTITLRYTKNKSVEDLATNYSTRSLQLPTVHRLQCNSLSECANRMILTQMKLLR
jgi:hypothetical protein